MIESIVLDILLMLIVFLMMAIGAYRGGMREAFSAGGLLLGVLVATEWLETWGGWLARNTSLSDGGARFLVAVTTMTLFTMAIGYGVGSSFNYHPGPGGRLFGIVLAGGAALVAMSYVLTWLRVYLFDGDEPAVIEGTFLARFLEGDAGLVLLLVSGAIVGAAILGSIVRERDSDSMSDSGPAPVVAAPMRQTYRERHADFPEKVEPVAETASHRTAPVRVRASQQWEDTSGTIPSRNDRTWSNTWPSDSPGIKPDDGKPKPLGDVRRARERQRRDGEGTPETLG
ncbi:hypothetical protein BH24CHL1_BH24CHL1_15740 [soil metagenome]|jgi:hypothetical protein